MNKWHRQIISAVRNKEVLMIIYEYERRTIEPHAYGRSSENYDVLKAYQTSGMRPGWRLFRADQIESLVETGNNFKEPRHDYYPSDSAMKQEVYCQL
jgi:predicted DNA-binding transcriptional regulator YafY